MNLPILKQAFERLPPAELSQYLYANPLGKYARLIGFYYEWLLGKPLDGPTLRTGNYVDALDPEAYFTAAGVRNTRWRINDNLLGDQRYCPLVRRTETIAAFQERRLDQSTKALIDQFEPELIHGIWGRRSLSMVVFHTIYNDPGRGKSYAEHERRRTSRACSRDLDARRGAR